MSSAHRGPGGRGQAEICESLCGLEVSLEGERIVKLRPNVAHVATQGFGRRFRLATAIKPLVTSFFAYTLLRGGFDQPLHGFERCGEGPEGLCGVAGSRNPQL